MLCNDLSSFRKQPNEHTTSNQRRFHVDITLICRRPNFDEFHVICTYFFDVILLIEKSTSLPCFFFRCNFDGPKTHIVSTYFFQCNFDGQKIHVVSTYFFRCNCAGRNIHVVSTYFFRCNINGPKIHVASTHIFRRNFSGQKLGKLT